MDFSDDVLDTITSEKLAVSHINSLRSALQQEKERVVAHKEYIDSLEKDKELFLLESHKKTIELELESIKQQLLLLCCGNSYNPSVIVDHLTNELLPKLNDEALLLFVLVKTGHSWTIVPSSDSNSHSNSISYGNSNNDSNNNSNSEWTTYHSVKQFQSAVIDDLVNSHSQSYVNLHYDIAISANSGNSGNSNCLSGVFKPLQSALPTDAVGFLQRSCSYDSSSNNNSYCVSEKDDVLLIVSPGVASCCWLILFPTATNLNTSYSNSNSYNNSNSNSNNNSSMRSARLSLANELSHLHDAPTYDNQGTGHNSNNNAWESWEQIFSLTSELVMSSLLNLFRLRKQLVQSSREKLQHCILQQLSCAKNSYSGNTNNHDSHSASSGRKKTNYYETRKQNELVWEGLANTVNEYIDSYIASLYGQKSGVLVSSTVLTLVNGRTVSSYAVASTHELVELVGKVNGRGNSTLAESINSNSIFELRVSSNKTDILRILEDIGEVKLLNNSAAIGTTRDVQNYTVISVPITACNTTVTSPPVSACLVVGLAAVGSSPSPRGHISSSFNKQQNVVDCIQADLKDIFPQGLPCSSILAFLVDRDLQPLTKTDIPFQRVGGAAAKRGRKRTGKQRGRSRSNSRSSYRTRSRSRSPSLASRDDQSDRYQQSVGRSKEVMFDEDVLHINLCCSNNIAEGNKALLAGQWELTDYEETLYVPPIGSSPEIDGIFVKYVASLSALLNCDWTCAVAQVQTPSVVQDIGEVSPPFDIASMYLTIASNGYYRLSDLDNLSSMRVLHQLFDQNSVEGQPQSPISYGTSRYNSNKGSDDDISTDSDQADFRLKRVAEVVGDYCCFVVDLVKALDVINQDGHCDGSHLHPSEYMPLLDELNSDHNYSVAALEKMHNTLMLKITLLPHDASSDTPKSPKSSQSIVIIAGRSWHKFNMVAIKTVSLELAQLMSYAYDFKLSNLQTKTIQKLQQEAEAQQRRSTELIESEKSIATNKDRQLKVLDEQQQLLYHGLVSLYQLLSRNKITLSPPKRNIHWKDEGGSKSPVTCPVADAIDAFDVSSNENVAKENRSGKDSAGILKSPEKLSFDALMSTTKSHTMQECDDLVKVSYQAAKDVINDWRDSIQKCKEERMVCDDFFQQLVTSHKKQEQSGDSLRKYCDEIVHAITIDKSPIVLLNSDGKPSAVRSDSEVYSEDGLFLSLRSSLQNLQYSHALLLTSIDSMCKLGLYEDVSSCAVKSILEAKCGSELISVNVHWKFNTSLPQSTEPIASTIGWTCNNTEDLIAGIAPEPINIAAFLRALQTKSSVILPNILLSDEIDISNTVTVQYIPVNVDSEPKPQDAQLLFARNDSVIVAVAEVLQSSRNTEKAGSVGESKASLDINGGDTSIDTTASLVHRLVEILTYAAKRILFYQRGREKNILYVGEGRLNSSTSLSSKLQAFTAQISGSSNSSSASIAANKFWLDSKFRVMVSENLAQLVGSSVGLMTPIIAHQDIYSDQNIWKGRVAIHMDDCSLRISDEEAVFDPKDKNNFHILNKLKKQAVEDNSTNNNSLVTAKMNWYGPKIFPSRASPSKSSKSYCTAIMLRLDSDFQLLLVDMERKPTEKDFFAIDSVIDSIVSLYREYCDRRLTRKQSEELQAIALSLASTTQQLILQDDYVKIQSAKNIFLGKLNSSHYISTVDFAKVDSLKQLVESDLRPILQGATKTKLVGFTSTIMDEVRTRCGIYSDQQQSEVKFPLKIDHVSQYLSNQFLLSEDSIDEKLSALALLARGCVLYEEISFNSSSSSSANSSGNSGAATIYIPVIPPFQRLKGFSDTDINLEFRGYAMEVTFNSTSDRALFLDRYILGKTENRRSSSSLQRRHLVSAVAEAAFSDTSKSKPFPYHKGEENTVLIQQSTAQIIPEICNCLENWFTHERSDLEYNNEDISNSCVRFAEKHISARIEQLNKFCESHIEAVQNLPTISAIITKLFSTGDFESESSPDYVLCGSRLLWYSGSEKDYSNNSTAIGNVWQSCKLAPGDLYATDAITDITSKYFKQWIQQSVLAFSEYNAWQIVTINEDLPSRIDEMFKSDSFGEINFGDKYNALLKEQWNSVLLSASYSYDTSVLLDVSAAGELMLLQLDFAVNSNRDAWTIPKQKVFEKLENTFMLLRNSTLQLLLFRSKVIEKRKDDETFNGLIEEHRLRTEILSHCLMILSTEGTKIPSLLNTIQEALGRLTNVRSTHLSCIDNISGKLLYEASAEFGTVVSNTIIPDNTDYQSVTNSISQTKESWNNSVAHRAVGDTPNKTSMNSPAADRSLADSVFATPSPLSAKSFSPSKTVHYAPNLFDHNGRLSAMSSPTMMSPASRSVSYVSLTNPGKANSVASINTEPFVLSPILRNSSTYPGYSNNVYHDHNNNPPVSSDRVAYQVREYVFDCYEVSGTLTITYDYTKPELEQENLHRNESVQSHQSTTKKSKYFFNDDAVQSGSTQIADDAMILETLTRSIARRVFELHRGGKNKQLMSARHKELSIRTSELQEKSQKVEKLELTNNMNMQELKAAATEADRMRVAMQAEQKILKESLQQKKDIINQLKQSIVDLRRETDKNGMGLNRQIQDYKETLHAMELELEKQKKETEKSQIREKKAEMARLELVNKINDLQRRLSMAENEIKHKKNELLSCEKDLSGAVQRELAIKEQEDTKLSVLLAKIKSLDEEVIAGRGSNSFLKKQLDSCMQTIKASQADAVTERTKLKQQLEESESSYRLLEKRLILTQQDLKRSEDSLFSVNEMLKAERKRCEQLSEKILLMEKEKDELIRGWSSFRAKIK